MTVEITVAAVQLRARGIEDADLALEEALAAVEQAADLGASPVVLPECTWPGYVLGGNWCSDWASTVVHTSLGRVSVLVVLDGLLVLHAPAWTVPNYATAKEQSPHGSECTEPMRLGVSWPSRADPDRESGCAAWP
ncbi:MAG: hypothetical protein DLM57_11310 [Pseudonocardiales bacterium]|nr:MAG: hypothetical protein DLM57_11310 [Pseudonocardiales bacterium]